MSSLRLMSQIYQESRTTLTLTERCKVEYETLSKYDDYIDQKLKDSVAIKTKKQGAHHDSTDLHSPVPTQPDKEIIENVYVREKN